MKILIRWGERERELLFCYWDGEEEGGGFLFLSNFFD
jgi:hypothetical protein